MKPNSTNSGAAPESTLSELRQERRSAIRAAQDSASDWAELTPVINVNIGEKPSSSPPSVKRRVSYMAGLAAIIAALGGAGGVAQCAQEHRVPAGQK